MQEGIYLDYNATTPVDPLVREAMEPYLGRLFGNPSSAHRPGQMARRGIEEARESVARLLGCEPGEIIFTSGGSEADALALLGTARARNAPGHVIAVSTEHPAVLGAFEELERLGHRATRLAVSSDGAVSPESLETAIEPGTFLASVMLANNETGWIQPIPQLASLARERGIVFHTDAVQAAGKLPVRAGELGVDLLSLSAHKLYGPKGIGALYVRSGTRLGRILAGGSQERGLRPGTENVPGIVGLGAAAALATERLGQESARIRALRESLWARLAAAVPGILRNSVLESCLPNTLHISLPGLASESLVVALDLEGVYVSGGAACHSGAHEPSHVLRAMGLERSRALSSLRLSLGRFTSDDDVAEASRRIAHVVGRMREAHGEAR
ncbi:MAG: cysteine desulfurase [Candidatus Riflebacteria bacterium]|nr:cysteine desulfurase [Candidatus Riflebacteria bacterium]